MLASCSQCPFLPQPEKQHKNKGLKLPQIIYSKDFLLEEVLWLEKTLREGMEFPEKENLTIPARPFLAMKRWLVTQWRRNQSIWNGPSWPLHSTKYDIWLSGDHTMGRKCACLRGTLEDPFSPEGTKILWLKEAHCLSLWLFFFPTLPHPPHLKSVTLPAGLCWKGPRLAQTHSVLCWYSCSFTFPTHLAGNQSS